MSEFAAAAWGEGFADLPVTQQMSFTVRVSELVESGVGIDAIMRKVETIKGEKHGKTTEPGSGKEVPSGEESLFGEPGAAQGGDTGRKVVPVTHRKTRKVGKILESRAKPQEADTGNTV